MYEIDRVLGRHITQVSVLAVIPLLRTGFCRGANNNYC